ncbi:transglutaminaseTgpA domain-containing protein [Aquabacterium sp.]|uniref:transglutaminase family protein n=1 Tax=Aquabacterium sp. TaxID=1872578 RepID=UPI003D6D7A20
MKRTPLPISREGRDTLWLLATLALIMAPHATRLPLWCALGAAAAMLWRAHMAWQDSRLPSRWVLFTALVVCVGLTLSTHRALFGREAGVTLVVVLTGLKTLELRARRDAFVVTSLGFFLILTQFLYSQSLVLAALMAMAVWGLMTSLVLAQRPLGRPRLLAVAREAGRTLVWGLPLMLVLFLLFPRIGPLWALPSDAQARSGLSDSLTLGNMAELALDESIAMHLRFEGPAPAPAALYFRGPVLDDFDGRTWRTRRQPFDHPDTLDSEPIETQGPVIRYQLTLEATHARILPLLEATLKAQVPPQQSPLRMQRNDLAWTTSAPLHERIQLDAEAWTRFRHGQTHTPSELESWRRLPRGFNPRTIAWAQAFHREPAHVQATPRQLAQALMAHIRRENFSYTLAPGDDEPEAGPPQATPSLHQIDRFWLDRRAGFCEHFASSFVVVMRAMGVPSRVVTGYQGAEFNPVDGLYTVRNSHAHAWAEYWQAGEGWVRADPTAAVAPERIDRNRPLAAPRSGLTGALPQFDSPLWRQGKAFWEATNHRWNVWVLQYSRGSQKQLLGKMGWDANDWADVARALTIALSSIAVAGVGWLWLSRERQRPSPWLGPMSRVHQVLLKAGIPPPEGVPAPASALAWANSLNKLPLAQAPQHAELTRHMVSALQALDALRYGPNVDAAGHPLQRRQQMAGAKPLIRAIEDGARQWRALRAKARHRAH